MKRLRKRLLASPAVQEVLCFLVFALSLLLYHTNRVTRIIDPAAEPYARGDKNAVAAFWHGKLLMVAFADPGNRPVSVLASHHGDGRLISRVMHHFGVGTVHGSTSRGGSAAVRECMRRLAEGQNICITPDGPRGPSRRAQAGAAEIAKLSGVPMIPLSLAATRAVRLNSWDQFMIPLPFGRIVYVLGAPIFVAADADDAALERARLQLQQGIDAADAQAEALCRQEPR